MYLKSRASKSSEKFVHSVFRLPMLAAKKTVINSSRGNLLLDLLTFFLKTTMEYFHFSFVHFIGAFNRQERTFAEFASLLLRSFLACTHG